MKGYRHNRDEVRRLASLPGIELWRYTAMELYSYGMLTPGYMFGGPDDKMTHAAAWIRGKKHELSDGAKVLLEPAEVYHVNGTPDPSERGSTSQVLIIQPSYLKYYLGDTQMESMNVARWRIHDADLDRIFHVATSAMKSDAIDDIERESH